jgi:hypothetical protein
VEALLPSVWAALMEMLTLAAAEKPGAVGEVVRAVTAVLDEPGVSAAELGASGSRGALVAPAQAQEPSLPED